MYKRERVKVPFVRMFLSVSEQTSHTCLVCLIPQILLVSKCAVLMRIHCGVHVNGAGEAEGHVFDLVLGTGPRHLGSTKVSTEEGGSNSMKELSLAERGKHAISTN